MIGAICFWLGRIIGIAWCINAIAAFFFGWYLIFLGKQDLFSGTPGNELMSLSIIFSCFSFLWGNILLIGGACLWMANQAEEYKQRKEQESKRIIDRRS